MEDREQKCEKVCAKKRAKDVNERTNCESDAFPVQKPDPDLLPHQGDAAPQYFLCLFIDWNDVVCRSRGPVVSADPQVWPEPAAERRVGPHEHVLQCWAEDQVSDHDDSRHRSGTENVDLKGLSHEID